MMIVAANYISTAFSDEDAKKLDGPIQEALDRGEMVQIDFSNIRYFTTLFFNQAVCKYLLQLGEEEFDRRFELTALSEVGQSTYRHSLENARNLAKLTPQERDAQMRITDRLDED